MGQTDNLVSVDRSSEPPSRHGSKSSKPFLVTFLTPQTEIKPPGSAPPRFSVNRSSKARAKKSLPRGKNLCQEHGMPGCIRCRKSQDRKSQDDGTLWGLANAEAKEHLPLIRDALTAGLRKDSFNAFPIANRGAVSSAVDHLVTILAPSLFPNMPAHMTPIMSMGFPFAVQHAEVFESLIAFSQSHHDSLVRKDGGLSAASLYHKGRAIQILQEKMSDPIRCADDASIMTNIFLTGVAVRMQDRAASEIFHIGMMKMVQVRGGRDKLGVDGYLSNCVMHMEAMDIQSTKATPKSDQEDQQRLTYPKHPFSPELCMIISRLPPGFEQFALNGSLSEETIRAAEKIFYWANKPGPPVRLAEEPAEDVIRIQHAGRILTDDCRIEQVVCLAMHILSTELFISMNLNTITDSRWDKIERYCLNDLEDTAERELRAWTLMTVAVASQDQDTVTKIGETVMDYLFEHEIFARSWDTLVPILRKFYFNDSKMDKWRICWEVHADRRQITSHKQGESRSRSE